MIRFSFRQDYLRLERTLDDFERRQLPYATARELTATAQAARREVERGIPSTFDRPTPFTQNSVTIRSATKTVLRSEVYVRPIQAKYLGLQEKGGTRRPKRTALVNPVNTRLNQYGNIPNKALARLKQRRDVFVGKVGGVGGLWQRPKRAKGATVKPKLLIRFDGPEPVKPHPFFFAPVQRVARRDFPLRLRMALAEALRTARR